MSAETLTGPQSGRYRTCEIKMIDPATFAFWRQRAAEKVVIEGRAPTAENLCKALSSFLNQENLTLTDAEIGLVCAEIGRRQYL